MPIRAIAVAACGLAALLCPTAAGLARTTTQAVAGTAQVDLEASRAAVAEIDVERLMSDRDYAAEMLGHLDLLAADGADQPELRAAIESLRMAALMTLDRRGEILASVEQLLAQRPREPFAYGAPISAALFTSDHELLVRTVEIASRNVPGVARAELRALLERAFILPVLQDLDDGDRDDLRVRLAESLFRIGWPGEGEIETSDFLRIILLEQRLAQGDRAAAADLAAAMVSPANLLPLLAMRKYDALFSGDDERVARLRTALAEYDRQTADNLAGGSATVPFVLERSRFLRALGRESEALRLLQPLTRDVAATVAAHDHGMWVVNQAVYVLLALGRDAEAVSLMERLVAVPISENGGLIGPYINHSIVLGHAGRHEEALAYARRIEQEHSRYANDYGQSVIASSIVCELAALGREAEAAPILDRLRASGAGNLSSLMRALICLDLLDEAEQVAIRRLEGDDAVSLALWFQQYEVQPERPPDPDPLDDRFFSLLERPAVRAAFERVGRRLRLPVARTVFSDY